MTPLEGETAIVALAIVALAPWIIGGALVLRRIWRVSTASMPKPPKPDAEPVTAPLPITEPSVRGVA